MGLSMEDVRTAISNANAAGPLGTFDGDNRAVTIGINDQLRNANEYDPLVVKTVNGTVIRLSDDRLHPRQRAQQPLRRLVQQRPFGPADHYQARQCQRHRHGRSHLRAAARTCGNGYRPVSTFPC